MPISSETSECQTMKNPKYVKPVVIVTNNTQGLKNCHMAIPGKSTSYPRPYESKFFTLAAVRISAPADTPMLKICRLCYKLTPITPRRLNDRRPEITRCNDFWMTCKHKIRNRARNTSTCSCMSSVCFYHPS